MKKIKKCYIEITNVCNLSCSFCPPSKRKPDFMRVDAFREILNKATPYVESVYLHVKGEPLLHPELLSILDAAWDAQIKVRITTNGTLIEGIGKQLVVKRALTHISFSLQSCEGKSLAEKHEYLDPIIGFAKEVTQASQMRIELRLWNLGSGNILSQDTRHNEDMLSILESAFDIPIVEEQLTGSRGIELASRVYLSQAELFEWPDIKAEKRSERGFCYGLRNQVGILVDGTVVPCCLDSDGVMDLGNIFSNDALGAILKSERADNIFCGFSDRKVVEALCKTCGYRERFN